MSADRIIAIATQKGGVGKTTTAVNLAASLAVRGNKILVVDMDPQGHAAEGLGYAVAPDQITVYDALMGDVKTQDAIFKTPVDNVDVLPSNTQLSGAKIELVSQLARELKLRAAFAQIEEKYDYILIDCPPSLDLLTLNSLTVADAVLVPLQCEYYPLIGLSQLLETVELVRASLNAPLQIDGILLTMYDARNNLSHQVLDEVRTHFPNETLETVIPRNVRLSEAPSHGQPCLLYDSASRGAQSYLKLADELLAKWKRGQESTPLENDSESNYHGSV